MKLLWIDQEADLFLHPAVGLLLQVGDAGKFPQFTRSLSYNWHVFRQSLITVHLYQNLFPVKQHGLQYAQLCNNVMFVYFISFGWTGILLVLCHWLFFLCNQFFLFCTFVGSFWKMFGVSESVLLIPPDIIFITVTGWYSGRYCSQGKLTCLTVERWKEQHILLLKWHSDIVESSIIILIYYSKKKITLLNSTVTAGGVLILH